MKYQRAGQAVSAPRAKLNTIDPVRFPWLSKVLTQKEIIRLQIAQDLAADPSICEPDIGLDRWPPQIDPIVAELIAGADTLSTPKRDDETMVDRNVTRPIWIA